MRSGTEQVSLGPAQGRYERCYLLRRGYQDYTAGQDPYGHGTAMAGVIWNNFTESSTNTYMGFAPQARILSTRVLNGDGVGTYETVIKGIQYVLQNQSYYGIRVMKLSLSGPATTAYFVDPLNRAVERAWANGIVVLAAAGNVGCTAESITVPGNDRYVITVGSKTSNRTAGFWSDDYLPAWSACGPTKDGFAKTDVLAPGGSVVTFMYRDPNDLSLSQKLVQLHPDFSSTTSLFRMSGTSISTALASAVLALILEAHPLLIPDEVKYRLMSSSRPAITDQGV